MYSHRFRKEKIPASAHNLTEKSQILVMIPSGPSSTWMTRKSAESFYMDFSHQINETILKVCYTLPQKKRSLNPAIFPVDPGSLAWCWVHWYTLFPQRNAIFKYLRFFWGRVYLWSRIIPEMYSEMTSEMNTEKISNHSPNSCLNSSSKLSVSNLFGNILN